MEKEYLTERINLGTCRPAINPLELCLVFGEYKINEEDNMRRPSLLSYSFEQ